MSVHWTQVLLSIALQHVLHAALLLALVVLVLQRARLSAEVRSWALCAAFALAAVSPLLVLLPAAATPTVLAPAPTPTPALDAAAPSATASPATATAQTGTLALPTAKPNPTRAGTAYLPALLQALALAWLLGTLVGLLRLAQGIVQARRLHRAARPAPALDALLGPALPRGTAVALCEAASGPMVVGLLAPRILVPPQLVTALSPPALRDLLLHEAAHVQRRDLWWCAAQRAVLAVYWWSPLLRQLGKRLELAREMACDARAAQQSSSGRDYAASLLGGIAGLLQQRQHGAPLAVGMSGNRSGLAQRVDSLLRLDGRPATVSTGLGWSVLCVAALAAHVGVTVAATPRLGNPVPPQATAERNSAPRSSAQLEQLLEAAADGDLRRAAQLVDTGVAVNSVQPGDGTALIAAARHGRLDMVDALLGMGADPNLGARGDGNPLIAAARRGHLPVVQRLVAAGADVNRIVPFDETPLINAARSGDVDTVAYLVAHGATVNLGVVADGGQWRSPLNQARSSEVRAYLRAQGAVAGRR